MKTNKSSFWSSPKGMVVLCGIAFIAYFLLIEHRQHLTEWLPYLILLLCPLMHVFMHGGHGGHDQHNDESERDAYQRGLEDARKDNEHDSH